MANTALPRMKNRLRLIIWITERAGDAVKVASGGKSVGHIGCIHAGTVSRLNFSNPESVLD